MTVSVTCVYSINPTGQKTAAQLVTVMQASRVPIPADFFTLTGATLTSDVSAVAGTQAVRTVVFNVTSLQFGLQFPNSAIGPFYGLLVAPIAAAVNCTVVESLPLAA